MYTTVDTNENFTRKFLFVGQQIHISLCCLWSWERVQYVSAKLNETDTENTCTEYNLFYNCLVNKLMNTLTQISQANYIQSK